jgi:hypothetical protein
MNNAIEPRGAAGPRRYDVIVETFGENPSAAVRVFAPEAPRDKAKANAATGARQIRNAPDVLAVHAARYRFA